MNPNHPSGNGIIIPGLGATDFTTLGSENFNDTQAKHGRRLSRDEPWGITVIIGGTNVRFCVTSPHNPKPTHHSVKWHALKISMADELERTGMDFRDAKHSGMKILAKECATFITEHFDEYEPPAIEKIAALNFSVAGIVEGDGLDARVTSSNTGFKFVQEPIAATVLDALQEEFRFRKWAPLQPRKIRVQNDAIAGLRGEMLLGDLVGINRGILLILGTGLGSVALTDGNIDFRVSEAGHRVIFDEMGDQILLVNDLNLRSVMNPDGSFVELPVGQYFAEHRLAGPWVATHFVKGLIEKPRVLRALAELAGPTLGKTLPEALTALYQLSELPHLQIEKWALEADPQLVRAVNEVLLNPNAESFFRHFHRQRSVKDAYLAKPESALAYHANQEWGDYWNNVGKCVDCMYLRMRELKAPTERVVVVGGIGEAANDYPHLLKETALELIHERRSFSAGTVVFSRLSPEMRDSAVTYFDVREEFEGNLAGRENSRPSGELTI